MVSKKNLVRAGPSFFGALNITIKWEFIRLKMVFKTIENLKKNSDGIL
jgi:hypothetical protein